MSPTCARRPPSGPSGWRPARRMPRPARWRTARGAARGSPTARTGAVAEAARDDAQGRFRRGEAVGFVEEQVLAWGDPLETLKAVLASLANGAAGEAPELISVLAGEGAPLGPEAVEELVGRDV